MLILLKKLFKIKAKNHVWRPLLLLLAFQYVKLHMTPRPEDLPVRAHPKVPKQGSRTDLETMVRSNQESRSKGNFVVMRQVQGQAIKLA